MNEFLEFIADELNADEDELALEMELINDIGLDSLSLMDLLEGLSEHYNIEFDSRVIQSFVTLNDVYEHIQRRISGDKNT